MDNGIEIPNLCHDPRLVPSGACRLCLVEVEGVKREVTACTQKITDGMGVRLKYFDDILLINGEIILLKLESRMLIRVF